MASDNLRAAALAHHEAGRAVIAIRENKKPYREGWNEYFTRAQTEAEVREHFSNGAYGAAMVLWPASSYAVLDFDGIHAQEAWELTGIELPETALNTTPSGGVHLYFRMPARIELDLKRKVRLVKAQCGCPKSCGVDLLIHGYAIIPPTPGYREDPDHPLEDAVLIPREILSLAQEKPTAENQNTGDRDRFDSSVVWEGIPEGERDDKLFRYACQMRHNNTPRDLAERLIVEAAARCKPPFQEQDALQKVEQAWKYPAGQNSIPSLNEGIGKETNWHPLSAAEILTLSTPQIFWVWQGLIPRGSLFLLCAFMKVGKTTLAYRLTLAIVQGLACLGRETTKTGVLILAVEEHIRDIRRRLERFGMTPEMEIYVIVDRGQARDLDKIREFVRAKNIGLILIDSLSRWWDVTDENNNMEVLRAVSPLLDLAHDDSFGVSIGLIVHERKSGGEDGRGIRGGSSLFGLVDQAIILDRRPGETSNKRLLKTLGRYEDSPKEIIIELVGDDYSVLGTPEQESFVQAVSKVRDALTAKPGKTIEPMDVKTLAAETALTQKMVRRVLEFMGDEITETGGGVRNDPHTYSLLSQYSPIGKETNYGCETNDQAGWAKER